MSGLDSIHSSELGNRGMYSLKSITFLKIWNVSQRGGPLHLSLLGPGKSGRLNRCVQPRAAVFSLDSEISATLVWRQDALVSRARNFVHHSSSNSIKFVLAHSGSSLGHWGCGKADIGHAVIKCVGERRSHGIEPPSSGASASLPGDHLVW